MKRPCLRLGSARPSISASWAALLALTACVAAGEADWPQILGPTRDGVASADEKLADLWPVAGPKVAWRRKVGAGYAGLAVRGTRGYVFHRLENREVIESIDVATGRTIWRQEHPTTFAPQVGGGDGPLCTPLLHEGVVITFGAQGVLSCHNAMTGEKRWRRDTHQDFGATEGYFGAGSSPLVASDNVIVNVGGTRSDAGIVAFSLATGETAWSKTKEPASYSSPVQATIGGMSYVVMVTRYQCLLLEPATGAIRWQFPFGMRGPTVNAAAPVVFEADDAPWLLVTASYGIGSSCGPFDADRMTAAWTGVDSLATQYCTPIVLGTHLYCIDGRDDVPPADFKCLEAKTGKVVWQEEGFGYGTLVFADGKLIAVKTDGEIVLVRPSHEKLHVISRARPLAGTLRALPALAGGKLFVRDEDTLVCLEVGP